MLQSVEKRGAFGVKNEQRDDAAAWMGHQAMGIDTGVHPKPWVPFDAQCSWARTRTSFDLTVPARFASAGLSSPAMV